MFWETPTKDPLKSLVGISGEVIANSQW